MSDNSRRITRYLSGKMDPDERLQFESDLKSDAELKIDYQLARAAQEILVGEEELEKILSDPDLQEAEQLVEKWEKKDSGQFRRHHRLRNFSWFYMAASILVSLLISYRLFMVPALTEKAYQDYYGSAGMAEYLDPGLQPEYQADYLKARHYYENDILDSALMLLDTLNAKVGNNPSLLIDIGITQLADEEFKNALISFKKASEIQGPYAGQASFFTGMCYLRLGDPKAALFYMVEKSGLSENFGEGTKKLIRRVNLINTFQFKQLRKEMAEDTEPIGRPGPLQSLIFFAIFYTIFLLAAVVGFTVYISGFKKSKQNWWIPFIIYLPLLGSVIYLLTHRKKSRNK